MKQNKTRERVYAEYGNICTSDTSSNGTKTLINEFCFRQQRRNWGIIYDISCTKEQEMGIGTLLPHFKLPLEYKSSIT